MPPLRIPGYYYDPEKKKYFKIENAHTAPSQAAWSSDAVKKRKTEAAAEKVARKRREQLRRHVRRHPILSGVSAAPGVLRREIGGGGYDAAGAAGDVELGALGWAGGVRRQGRVRFGEERGDGRNLSCLWVGGGGGGEADLGVAYTTVDEESLVGSYIPEDIDGRIRFDPDAPWLTGRRPGQHVESVRCPQMSSIQYHKPSNKILLTSREPDQSCGLFLFSPPTSDPGTGRPNWLLGESNFYQRLSMRHRNRNEWLVHSSAPAPSSSSLLCILATNAGMVRVASNENMAIHASPSSNTHSSKSTKRISNLPPSPKEVLDVDFQKGNHNIVLAGGRSPRLWVSDLRAPEAQWTFIKHASSVAKVRSANEWQVVVAGLQSSLAVYDLRYAPTSEDRKRGNGWHKPLLTLPSYRNEAHVHVGFDVCAELGAVAAAQDDGTVSIFSLKSGRRVSCEGLDGAMRGRRGQQPVRALMFAEGERERTPSLWVGEGLGIVKYGFGRGDMEEGEG